LTAPEQRHRSVPFDLNEAKRVDASLSFHERVYPLAGAADVMPSNYLFQFPIVEAGKELIRQSIAENPCVLLEELLPNALVGGGALLFFDCKVFRILQEPLKVFKLLASVSDTDQIAFEMFALRQLDEHLLVLSKKSSGLAVIQYDVPKLVVGKTELRTIPQRKRFDTNDECQQRVDLGADERKVFPLRRSSDGIEFLNSQSSDATVVFEKHCLNLLSAARCGADDKLIFVPDKPPGNLLLT
jgi:hypothetical protein